MSDKSPKRRGLGRGLSALMSDLNEPEAAATDAQRPEMIVAIETVVPNPDQPRRQFDPEKLDELAASIAEKGIIQPLIVRPDPKEPGRYQIIAGERRWRAAQKARLHEVPVVVRDLSDVEVLEIAIIENIQRADLNAVEEAAGYRQLMDRFGHTQEALAKGLGKSRSHIANTLRLLNLPEDVQALLSSGKLSAGHARALIPTDQASKLAREIVRKGLSVRQTEALVKRQMSGAVRTPALRRRPVEKDADTRALEGDLSAAMGMRVAIEHQGGTEAGQVVIGYTSFEQLDQICRILGSQENS